MDATLQTQRLENRNADRRLRGGFPSAVIAALRWSLLALLKVIVAIRYRLGVSGQSNLPKTGGVLLCGNHVAYADCVLVALSAGRPVRFIGTVELLRYPWTWLIFRLFNVITISPKRAKEAICLSVEALRNGDVVCIFPEGKLTTDGEVAAFQRGAELIARRARVPVVPFGHSGLWGSSFSFYGGKAFSRLPRLRSRRVDIRFGAPIAPGAVHAEVLRAKVCGLIEAARTRRSQQALGLLCEPEVRPENRSDEARAGRAA